MAAIHNCRHWEPKNVIARHRATKSKLLVWHKVLAIWISWPGVHGGVISVSFRIVAAILKFKTEAFTDCCHTNALYGCHGLRVYPVCVCNTVRLGQVRSRHNLKPSGTRFECVSGLSV